MNGYLALKHVHVTAVALSGTLFFVRGMMMLADSPRLSDRWARILPHVIDTLLLASAIGLVVWSGQIPFVQAWLGAKVVALVFYIVFGTLALKRAPTKGARCAFLLLALLSFAYIVSVALTRQVLPWQAHA